MRRMMMMKWCHCWRRRRSERRRETQVEEGDEAWVMVGEARSDEGRGAAAR